jgi:hypothetical protein
MPLDTTNRNSTRAEAIAEAFAAITLTPRPKRAADAVAVEYYVASTLLSAAEKRRDLAKREAVAAKVIPNGGLEIGTHARIYVGEIVEISANVTPQADKLDGAGLVADLLAAGVRKALLARLVKRHTHEFAPAHRYVASLVTA